MNMPAWEIWSNDVSWGMRELDTRMLREGASIEEAYSNTVYHIDMGCIPEKSDGNDAKFMGQFLKDWAWNVGMPQLLEEHRELRRQVHSLARQVHSLDAALAACEQGE